MWVHLYDAHHPYDPPQPYKSKYASAPYDGGVAYVDSVVGKFLTQLRTRARTLLWRGDRSDGRSW